MEREDLEQKRYDDWAKKIEEQHERKLKEMRIKKEASDVSTLHEKPNNLEREKKIG